MYEDLREDQWYSFSKKSCIFNRLLRTWPRNIEQCFLSISSTCVGFSKMGTFALYLGKQLGISRSICVVYSIILNEMNRYDCELSSNKWCTVIMKRIKSLCPTLWVGLAWDYRCHLSGKSSHRRLKIYRIF